MASRPIVVAVFSTVYVHRQGWSMPAYLFSFFPLCAFEGCQMHEEHFILFCNALVLISMSCIFVWSLNRVGCEIWDLSRNHKWSYFWSKLGSTLNFKPFLHLYGFFFACASNSDCMRSITPHTCVGPPTHVLFYLSLPSLSRPYVLCSFSCSYGVPPSPSMFVGWLHCTHDRLARRSHRNCAALVRSGG